MKTKNKHVISRSSKSLLTIATTSCVLALSPLFAAATEEITPPTRSDTATSSRDRSTATTPRAEVADGVGALSYSDKKFILEAARQSRAEMELSQLALSRGTNTQVRELAQQISTDHQRSHAELEQLAARKGVSLTTDARTTDSARKLAGEKGAAFDKEYVERISEAHDDTVELFEKASRKSDDPEVAAFASRQLPSLQAHQSMSNQLEKSLN